MYRLGISLLIVLLLAACSGAPQKTSRGPSSSTAASGAFRTIPPGFPNFVDHSVGREEISIQAMSLVGIPYRWGGNTPDSGFDCSGLVRYVVQRAASVNLPRTTADMSGRGESIDPDEVAPGDLIFFNTTGRAHSHVGIYVGKLRFVNAPSTGGTVRLDYLTNPYWAKRFDGIRRVAAPTAPPKPAPFDAPAYQASVAPEPVAPQAVARPATQAATSNENTGYGAQSRLTPGSGTSAVSATANAGVSTATAPAPMAQADQFEPPPPVLSAAQMQARAAGAVTPSAVAPTRAGGREDAIDAAADAFEPPPSSASAAARQAQQAQYHESADSPGDVQIMRASTASRGIPAATRTTDDPIARFANGSY
ncbi:NlpC/P60 family protein [Paraburkholderia sp.]|uniref:C40 family peptidase n=1 Tax=Paraburkholderia sp. TaxID=1926495 RepID=UPI0023865EBB|nr:NlpC/P60 family protein [Paraburkholderia sp.]MDE1184423.1 NlpC/P60 family protein [Paraburkholderia sp.]